MGNGGGVVNWEIEIDIHTHIYIHTYICMFLYTIDTMYKIDGNILYSSGNST